MGPSPFVAVLLVLGIIGIWHGLATHYHKLPPLEASMPDWDCTTNGHDMSPTCRYWGMVDNKWNGSYWERPNPHYQGDAPEHYDKRARKE